MFAAVAADLGEEELESDAKSQDSMDLLDSRASSPPPLHNGKVQYPPPHPHTDRDWVGGPPKLERAISPSAAEETESQFVEVKRDDDASVTVSPTDTIEAAEPAEEDKSQSPPSSSPPPPKAKSPHSDSDQNGNQSGEVQEAGNTVEMLEAEPSCQDSVKMELGSSTSPEQQVKEEVVDVDVRSSHPNPDTQSDKAGEGDDASEKMEMDKESEVKETEPENAVKEEKADSCHSPADKSPSGKAEDLTAGEKEQEPVQAVSGGQVSTLEEDKAPVKSEGSSTGKVEDNNPGNVEKPEYVKLKEKIIQGEIERLQREKLLKQSVVSTGVGVDGLPVRTTFLSC